MSVLTIDLSAVTAGLKSLLSGEYVCMKEIMKELQDEIEENYEELSYRIDEINQRVEYLYDCDLKEGIEEAVALLKDLEDGSL